MKHGEDNFSLDNVWSKTEPYKTIVTHSIEAGTTANLLMTKGVLKPGADVLAKYWGIPVKKVIEFISFLVSHHDIGKISPFFQQREKNVLEVLKKNNMYQANMDTSFRHEVYGQELVHKILKNEGFKLSVSSAMSQTIALHHQKEKQSNLDALNELQEQVWGVIQKEFSEKMKEWFPCDWETMKDTKPDETSIVCDIITGIIIMSDWIASCETLFVRTQNEFLTKNEYLNYLRKTALSFMRKNDLIYKPIGQTGDFSSIFGINTKRPIQEEAEKIVQMEGNKTKFVLIEAPCGEGKTETGLFFAYKMGYNKNGVYFGLPTSATSESMADRYYGYNKNIGLSKGPIMTSKSFLMSNKSYDAKEWMSDSRRKMFHSSPLGTVDQLMMAVRLYKYNVLRLLALTNKVLVIDEVHAYDAYMTTIIINLLEHCKKMDIPVVLMSATLPLCMKKDFINVYCEGQNVELKTGYPLITTITEEDNQFNCSQYETCAYSQARGIKYKIENCINNQDKIAEICVQKISDGGCLCLIANDVKTAVKLYKKIEKLNDGSIQLHLLHARNTEENKKAKIKEIKDLFGKDRKDRPYKAIVVATQIIEQSIDVDFDYMCTFMAPIDLLIQRLGRLWRHDDKGTIREYKKIDCPVIIFAPEENRDGLPYKDRYGITAVIYEFEEILNNTLESLMSMKNQEIIIPDDVPVLVNKVYSNTPLKNMMELSKKTMARIDNMNISKGRFSLYEDRQKLSSDSSLTRHSDMETVSVALVDDLMYNNIKSYLDKKDDIPFNVCKDILLNKTVNVPFYLLKEMSGAECLYENDVYESFGVLTGTIIYKTDNCGMVSGNGHNMYIDDICGLMVM